MASVELKNICKIYPNGAKAVDDFNMVINDKEFIVFVGPSGCGKSTTLRMIAGLEYITSGELKIGDRVVNNIEPKDRNIAMVFQNYALYPHMTVFGNIAFGLTLARTPVEKRDENTVILKGKDGKKLNPFVLFFAKMFARTLLEQRDDNGNIVTDESGQPVYVTKKNKDGSDKLDKDGKPIYKKRRYTIDEYNGKPITDENGKILLVTKTNKDGSVRLNENGEPIYKMRKYTKSEIRDKVEEAARILDIVQYLERKPKQLSGGQRQRVAIGRAIVRNPKVFLMDEPLSNLDAKLRNQMRAEIILLRKRINTTFIYVTHDQTEAMTLGDRIVIMKDGVVQQIGTPTEVFSHPANLFVAGFIGTPQMNYFDAKLTKHNGDYCVELYGKKFKLPDETINYLKEQLYPEKDIILGVRPEHFIPEIKGGESVVKFMDKHLGADGKMAFIETKVAVSEMMGSELYVHATTEDNKKVIIRVPTINLSKEDRENIENGGNINITFSPQVMHIFDKETESNIIPLLEHNIK